MTAEECLKTGDLDRAFSLVKEGVRAKPQDYKLRTFLFQLFCVQGEWERAIGQLAVVAELEKLAIPMAQMYREAIRCEVFRREVFEGKRTPHIFGEPPAWVGPLVQALPLFAEGKATAATQLRDEAFAQAPATSGKLNDAPLEWIADADPRLGPILEVIVNGRYYWAPFESIQSITFEKPEDLRDYVWMPVHFKWSNGGETVGLIPSRYPGAEKHSDPLVKLGRKTIWENAAGEEVPQGQRMLATNEGETALLDIRKIELDTALPTPPVAEPA